MVDFTVLSASRALKNEDKLLPSVAALQSTTCFKNEGV